MNKVIKGNCEECQFEPENGHAHTCSKRLEVMEGRMTDCEACGYYICRCETKEFKKLGH